MTTDGLRLGQQQVHLGAGCVGSVGHGGSFYQLLTEATSVALQLPKPCHTNLVLFLLFTRSRQIAFI